MTEPTAAARAPAAPVALLDEQWAAGPRVLDAALDAASMGLWRYRLADQRCELSPRAQILYGLDSPAFRHDEPGVRDLLHPDDIDRMWDAVARAIDPAGDGRYGVDYRVRRRDGGWRWLRVWGLATFSGEGDDAVPLGLTGASCDITPQKQADVFRDAQKHVLELIVGDAPLVDVLSYLARVVERQADGRVVAGILFLDHEGRLRHGAAPSLPHAYNAAVDGLTASAHLGTCSATAATGEVVVTQDIAADPRWASIKHLPLGLGLRAAWSQPILARDGRVLGTFGTYFRECRGPSVEERQAVELLAGLAALAIERARAAAALCETQRRKDEFLAMLSHELRNPLAPLRTALHLLRAAAAPEQAALVATMDRQVDQLIRLVDDLLEVSRISRGTLELQCKPVLAGSFVALAIETVEPACRAAAHHLDVSLPDAPVWVDGDEVRLAQVVTNLLHNAVRYTAPGGRIGLEVRADESHVTIAVADTGSGIDPRELPDLFEPFVRGTGAGSPHRDGLGIGLALSRHLAELHGGTLHGHSDGPGCGSTFTLRLPRLVDDRLRATPSPPDRRRLVAPLNRRVVIVDDNVDVAAMTEAFLQALSCDTHVAHDGAAALAVAARVQPDVVLLDIGLPDMTGYEVCRRLRAQSGERPLRIVALTGWGQEADRAESAAAGFDAHLVKPVDPDRLADVVRAPR